MVFGAKEIRKKILCENLTSLSGPIVLSLEGEISRNNPRRWISASTICSRGTGLYKLSGLFEKSQHGSRKKQQIERYTLLIVCQFGTKDYGISRHTLRNDTRRLPCPSRYLLLRG